MVSLRSRFLYHRVFGAHQCLLATLYTPPVQTFAKVHRKLSRACVSLRCVATLHAG